MAFQSGIYKSYDIRGIVPQELDAEEMYHIGRAYAATTGAKNVVVARDMRPSGDELEPALVRGLREGGVDVLRIGLATTPLFYFSVHHFKAEGGLMVTASHNPGQYNGIKLTRAEALPIGASTGLMAIRDLVEKRDWAPASLVGEVKEVSAKEEYLNLITGGVSAEGLKIVVDAGNGMAGLLLSEFFKRVGGEVTPLYWELDGTFPNHEANPLVEENLRDLKKAVKEHKADLGVAFDGDADRVFFTTEKGEVVPGDITMILIALELVREHPGLTMLYDLRSTRTVKEVIEKNGGKTIMSKVGHSNIKPQMRETGAIFAGEVSGHFFFAPWYAESSFLALGYMLRILQREHKPFSEIIRPLQHYPKTPEINFEVEDKTGAIARLKERYADAEILELDGVSVMYPDWWANVRASNTEPLLRLNMEANTPELLQEKRTEIESIIHAD